jgi:DNA-binding NarL/FixJ family response regulator
MHAAEAAAEAAQAHRRAGNQGPSRASAARAQGLLDEQHRIHTPALAAGISLVPLTTREHEVATLAARGLSTRQIAERLTLSVRTVDNHLHRAYTKLGVSSRADLSRVLGV